MWTSSMVHTEAKNLFFSVTLASQNAFFILYLVITYWFYILFGKLSASNMFWKDLLIVFMSFPSCSLGFYFFFDCLSLLLHITLHSLWSFLFLRQLQLLKIIFILPLAMLLHLVFVKSVFQREERSTNLLFGRVSPNSEIASANIYKFLTYLFSFFLKNFLVFQYSHCVSVQLHIAIFHAISIF